MIDLTALPLFSASPSVMDFGGVLTPATGGPRQRVNRIGTRHAIECQTPKMPIDTGRVWAGRLARAKIEGGLIAYPEPGLVFDPIGVPNIASAVTGGMAAPVRGMIEGRVIPESKALSIIHDGRRYLYFTTAEVTVAPGGTATLPVFPMLRSVLATGDLVELLVPKVQGELIGDFSWPIDVDEAPTFGFRLEESE